MIYHYTLPWPVLDGEAGTLLKNRADGVLLSMTGEEAQAATPLGTPTLIRTGPIGTTISFTADIPAGRVRFGGVEAAVFADENLDAADRAEAALAAAQQVVEKVEWIGENANEVTYFYRTTSGDVWVSDTPIIQGGGKPRVTAAGDVIVSFPT